MFTVRMLFVVLFLATASAEMLVDSIKKDGVVPDVLSSVPDNIQLLSVDYGHGHKATLGNKLTPTQVKEQPKLSWEAKEDKLYTVVMTDPDAPSRANPIRREYKHWIQLNVPGGNVEKGEYETEYIGAGPPQGTGLHRYILLVYEQTIRHSVSDKVTKKSAVHRPNWSVEKFAKEHKLKGPVAINYFQAQYDDYVPILHKQLSGH